MTRREHRVGRAAIHEWTEPIVRLNDDGDAIAAPDIRWVIVEYVRDGRVYAYTMGHPADAVTRLIARLMRQAAVRRVRRALDAAGPNGRLA